MSASLVGSEMCIRDRLRGLRPNRCASLVLGALSLGWRAAQRTGVMSGQRGASGAPGTRRSP
eukprot:13116869-Alexandrium_andersonii.AAC.1